MFHITAFFPSIPTVALYQLDRGDGKREILGLLMAAAACLMRPTAILTWAVIVPGYCWSARGRVLLMKAVVVACVALTGHAALERWYYGSWQSSMLNFAVFNFFTVGVGRVGIFFLRMGL